MWHDMLTQQKRIHGDLIRSSPHQSSDESSPGSSSSSSSSGGGGGSGGSGTRGVVSDKVVEVSPQQLEEAGYGEVQQLLAPLVGKSPQELEGCLPQVLPRLAPLLADGTMRVLYLPTPKRQGSAAMFAKVGTVHVTQGC
jgi:hypothetical protein